MKYAILAAGEGSRLHEEGVDEPKPLVKVGGEHLVDRLCRLFRQNGAREMAVSDLSSSGNPIAATPHTCGIDTQLDA